MPSYSFGACRRMQSLLFCRVMCHRAYPRHATEPNHIMHKQVNKLCRIRIPYHNVPTYILKCWRDHISYSCSMVNIQIVKGSINILGSSQSRFPFHISTKRRMLSNITRDHIPYVCHKVNVQIIKGFHIFPWVIPIKVHILNILREGCQV